MSINIIRQYKAQTYLSSHIIRESRSDISSQVNRSISVFVPNLARITGSNLEANFLNLVREHKYATN